jgi:hypothetical protein
MLRVHDDTFPAQTTPQIKAVIAKRLQLAIEQDGTHRFGDGVFPHTSPATASDEPGDQVASLFERSLFSVVDEWRDPALERLSRLRLPAPFSFRPGLSRLGSGSSLPCNLLASGAPILSTGRRCGRRGVVVDTTLVTGFSFMVVVADLVWNAHFEGQTDLLSPHPVSPRSPTERLLD